MSDHHTWFGKRIADILSIFKSSAVKVWGSLTPEEQASVKNASGIINIINTHIAEVPSVIKEAIVAAYPNEPQLEASLLSLCSMFGITPPTLDFDGAVAAIQAFLAAKEGTVWQWASSALAQALSIVFNPDIGVFAKVAMIIEYAYQTFIRR